MKGMRFDDVYVSVAEMTACVKKRKERDRRLGRAILGREGSEGWRGFVVVIWGGGGGGVVGFTDGLF